MKRNRGTYGGSAAMFPPCDRTTEDKLERARGWVADDEKWLRRAMKAGDPIAAQKARRSLAKYRAVVEALEICQRKGKEFSELGGRLDVAA